MKTVAYVIRELHRVASYVRAGERTERQTAGDTRSHIHCTHSIRRESKCYFILCARATPLNIGIGRDMSSSDQEDDRAVIGILSVAEMAAVLGDRAHIGSGRRRSKARVVDDVLSLPTALRDDVIAAAIQKRASFPGTPTSRKREREAERQRERRVRRRIEEPDRSVDVHEHTGSDDSHHTSTAACAEATFLHLPTDEQRRALYRDFYEASSASRLKEQTCAVCARRLNVVDADISDIPIEDIPNHHRLCPTRPHEAHHLVSGMLLCSEGCREEQGKMIASICRSCRRDLGRAESMPPRLSLANGLWVGEIPWQLHRLSFPEQLLIAHLYPRVYVIKLFPKDRRAHSPETLQSALAGNVTTFAFNMEKISDMIMGTLMPQRPAVLASVLSVTYVGTHKPCRQWLKSTFNVRRAHVGEALRWLKAHNPKYYRDIVIDAERMQSIPEDDVPMEILANMHHEKHVDVVDTENDTYVPPDSDDSAYGQGKLH